MALSSNAPVIMSDLAEPGSRAAPPDRTDPQTPPLRGAHDPLFTQLYTQLRRIARREVHRHGANAPLGATTLMHEAYLAMHGRDSLAFPDQAHFLAYAGRAMRGLLISELRERGAQKRGGDCDITALSTEVADDCEDPTTLHALNDALDDLAELDPALATVVDLKYFGGFTVAEIASMQNVSERTVHRQWEKARILLFKALSE